MAAGDVRGELVLLQISIESAPPERLQALRAAERELFHQLSGPLGLQLLAGVDAQWSRGFVRSLRSPPPPSMRALFAHPSMRFIEEISLDNPHLDLEDQVELLGKLKPRTLSSVRLRSQANQYRYDGAIGLGPLLKLPALKTLDADGSDLQLTGSGQSEVESLHAAALTSPLSVFADWKLPALTQLSLGGRPSVVVHDRFLGLGMVREVALPPIERPRLSLPECFAEAGWAPALKEARFSIFVVLEEDVRALLGLAKRCPRVEVSECLVSRPALARLKTAASSSVVLPDLAIDALEPG